MLEEVFTKIDAFPVVDNSTYQEMIKDLPKLRPEDVSSCFDNASISFIAQLDRKNRYSKGGFISDVHKIVPFMAENEELVREIFSVKAK